MELDPVTIGSIIGGFFVAVTTAFGVVKARNGKAAKGGKATKSDPPSSGGPYRRQQSPPPEPQPAQPAVPRHIINTLQPDKTIDPAGDTGRFVAALANAPDAVLEDMARSLREVASQRPATRADVKAEVSALHDELAPRLDVHSNAIGELRLQSTSAEKTVDELRQCIDALPCRDQAPVPCPKDQLT